jgi:signal transduction histidine kinase
LPDLWQTTAARLSLFYGLIFAAGVIAVLGMVYFQSAIYLTDRVDRILHGEARLMASYSSSNLADQIQDALSVDGSHINLYGLFSEDGRRITGNLETLPPTLKPGGRPVELAPTAIFPANARAIATRLPSGDVLVVGRNVNQQHEIRAIIFGAMVWSGVAIIVAGLVLGTAFSLGPLRRVRALQAASHEIAAGNLKRRMPVSARRDELDMLASTTNHMMDEIDRLISEIRGAGETLAHDLRTPLTRARAQLARLQADSSGAFRRDADLVVAEIDSVLDRFRAILRLSELEARERRAGFVNTSLGDIVDRAFELYQPLAEAAGVSLVIRKEQEALIEADPRLLFEAVSNLVDNAVKFTPSGGQVEIAAVGDAGHAILRVCDSGPGIAETERAAVLQRFYRSERDRLSPGSGLGLSIASAIVRLHGFELRLENTDPGLCASIDCHKAKLAYSPLQP